MNNTNNSTDPSEKPPKDIREAKAQFEAQGKDFKDHFFANIHPIDTSGSEEESSAKSKVSVTSVIPSFSSDANVRNDGKETAGVMPQELIDKEIPVINDGSDGDFELPPSYYVSPRRSYAVQGPNGRWKEFSREQMKVRLRKSGLSRKVNDSEDISEVDAELVNIEDDADVIFCGKLAGHKEGYFEANGIRGLVTESYHLTKPEHGEFPTIKAFLRGLLNKGTCGREQLEIFTGWVKSAFESLQNGHNSLGQCLFIAGEQGAGKSQLQKLITLILGGRQANSHLYMSGRTNFNADLCEAEHLILDDEYMATDIRSRLAFAANIKKHCVGNNVVTYHAKGKDGFPVSPWWRVSCTLNDNPERLLALPPMDEDVADKVILLKAYKQPLPCIDGTAAGYAMLWTKINEELSAYLYNLTTYEIPQAYHCVRYQVKSFHHPDLASELGRMTPQRSLLETIDSYLWISAEDGLIGGDKSEILSWQGTAKKLREIFIGGQAPTHIQRQFNEAIKSDVSLGKYLSRLEDSTHPEEKNRVLKKRSSDSRDWIITKQDRIS